MGYLRFAALRIAAETNSRNSAFVIPLVTASASSVSESRMNTAGYIPFRSRSSLAAILAGVVLLCLKV